MFVNFINPRYPGEDTAAGTCHFRLLKNSPDVCQIRVDFVDTVTNIRILAWLPCLETTVASCLLS